MKSRLLVLLLCLIITNAQPLFACGNYYYYADRPLPYKSGFLDYHKLFVTSADSTSAHHPRGGFNPYFLPVGIRESKWGGDEFMDVSYGKLRDTLIKLSGITKDYWKVSNMELATRLLSINADYKLLSDFAWKLARRNELAAAEKVLVTLHAKYPLEYNILANLGTVYELRNKSQQALECITKAVQLSPGSHYGSEWLHINILKMKTGAMVNWNFTDFFALHPTQANYSDRLFEEQTDPASWGKVHRDSLMVHIAYQLHERMFFINKKDPIMAEMFYMFIQCMIHRGDWEYLAEATKLYMYYSEPARYPRVIDALQFVIRKKPNTKT